jgi:hypothetical protein
MPAPPSQPPGAASRGGDTLRQAALVAGVGVARAATAADGKLTRVVRQTPRPLLAAAGVLAAAVVAALIHVFGAAPVGGGLPHVAPWRDEGPPRDAM